MRACACPWRACKSHLCALTASLPSAGVLLADASVACWGDNTYLQIADTGASYATARVQQLAPGYTAAAVACGWHYSCVSARSSRATVRESLPASYCILPLAVSCCRSFATTAMLCAVAATTPGTWALPHPAHQRRSLPRRPRSASAASPLWLSPAARRRLACVSPGAVCRRHSLAAPRSSAGA